MRGMQGIFIKTKDMQCFIREKINFDNKICLKILNVQGFQSFVK